MGKAEAAQFKDKGNKALAAKNFDEAIAMYTEAIANDPTDHVFYSNRSAAYLSKGDAQAALTDGEKCIELNKAWGKGYGRKAAALHALGRYDDAIDTYEAGIEIEPSNQALKDGLKEAEEAGFKAMSRGGAGMGGMPGMGGQGPFGPGMIQKLMANPRFLPYLADEEFRAKLNGLMKDPNAMQTAIMMALGNQGGAGGAGPQDPRMMEVVSYLLGINETGTPGEEEAPRQAAPGAKSAPAPAPAPAPKAAPAPLEPKAESKEEDDGLSSEERAAKRARKAEALSKKEAGNEAYKGKRFAEALSLYESAVELDPEEILYRVNIAAVHMEEGRYDQAVDTCLQAVEKGREVRAPFSSIAKAYLRAGNAHYKAGRLEQAVDMYDSSLLEHRTEEATKKSKDTKAEIKTRAAQAYLDPAKGAEAKERGNESFKAGDFVKALAEYSEAIKRDPTNAVYYNNRASAKAKLMDFNGAMDDADKALKIDPKYVKAIVRKGNCQLALQEVHKALDTFKAALALEPENSEAKEGLKRVVAKINVGAAGNAGDDEERRARALADPEIQAILRDPMVNSAIEEMQTKPGAFARLSRDPTMGPKIEKLIAAGILRTA